MAEKEELAIQVSSRAFISVMRYLLEQKNMPTLDKNIAIKNLETKLTKVFSNENTPRTANLNSHIDIDNNKTFKHTLKKELKELDVPNQIKFNKTTNKFHVFFPSNERDKVNISLENTIIKIADKGELNQQLKKIPIKQQIKTAIQRSEQKNSTIQLRKTRQREKVR